MMRIYKYMVLGLAITGARRVAPTCFWFFPVTGDPTVCGDEARGRLSSPLGTSLSSAR